MQNFETRWNAQVAAIQQGAADAAAGRKLSRVTRGLSMKERRRGQRGVFAQSGDILDSLHYWRKVRRACSHAAVQYAAHRRVAMARVEVLA